MVAGGGDSGRQITSLLRWKSGEREKLFENLDLFLSSPEFTENFFPKVSSIFLDLYDEVKKNPQLRAIVTKNKTKYPLYIPSSPRYFISALKKPVTRASMKTLYFNSAEDLDKAYLLLNSSFMYWWWRVRDGGMTLSLETLLSMPMPDFKVDRNLVELLENSEVSNLVYKKNAGALHENVKHDKALLSLLNKSIFPEYGLQLLLTHENSELVQL